MQNSQQSKIEEFEPSSPSNCGNDEETERSQDKINVRKGKVDSLDVYEVASYELDIIISGSTSSIFFNLLMLFSGLFISSLIAVLTTSFEAAPKLWAFFLFLSVSTVIVDIVMFILWRHSSNALKDVVSKIKNRIRT